MQTSRAVQSKSLHIDDVRGDHIMEENNEKYAATYHFGKTVVHVVEPTTTHEEQQKAIHDFHMAGWSIIDELVEKGEDV